MRAGKLLLAALTLALLVVSTGGIQGQEPMAYRIVAYYSSWSIYARSYFVTEIPAGEVTHINYAFFNVSRDGECVLGDQWADIEYSYPDDDPDGDSLRGNFHQLQLLKEANPHLQTLMAVGGWTWSGRFSDVALTAESRERFAQSCIALMIQYGFDGVDVDWEYPTGGGMEGNTARPEDRENFTLLLAEMRRQLDAQGEQDGRVYLLTIAAPAGNQRRNIELDRITTYLDWINLMAYDVSGAWSAVTGFNAPLYPYTPDGASVDTAVQYYLAAGVPPDKLVLGVPFYGRVWRGVADVDHGLGQPFEDVPGDGGFFDYSTLAQYYIPTHTRYWDNQAQVPWLYSPATTQMISYDDPESLAAKAAYVQEQGLGGIMIWELANDDADHTLLSAVYNALDVPQEE